LYNSAEYLTASKTVACKQVQNFRPPRSFDFQLRLNPLDAKPFSLISAKGFLVKGLGAIRAKIGPTSDVDKIFSKMYSQYVLFRNKYS
jgi:hypothetical protein